MCGKDAIAWFKIKVDYILDGEVLECIYFGVIVQYVFSKQKNKNVEHNIVIVIESTNIQ